jgi:hypothetical protein
MKYLYLQIENSIKIMSLFIQFHLKKILPHGESIGFVSRKMIFFIADFHVLGLLIVINMI